MSPTIWVTPHYKSQVVLGALHRGTRFLMRPIDEAPYDPGPSVVYGILRGCSELIHRCATAGSPYWNIDHGYFGRRRDFSGYYRITKNGLAAGSRDIGWSNGSRWRSLGIQLAEPLTSGTTNIAIPPTLPIRAHFRLSAWPVSPDEQISEKDGTPLEDMLLDGRHVRAFNSMGALDAWVKGVPATQEYGPLDKWHMGEREHVCSWLADQQWTLEEMEAGKCSMSWS